MSFERLSESVNNISVTGQKTQSHLKKDHTAFRQEYTSDNDFSIDFSLRLREHVALRDLVDDQIFDAIQDWRRKQITFDKRSEYFRFSN